MNRDRLLIGPAGRYHADRLDGDAIVATPVEIEWVDRDDGGTDVVITPSGPQVALPADDPRVFPYEGSGTAAEVFSR